jgi:hypothetical protein
MPSPMPSPLNAAMAGRVSPDAGRVNSVKGPSPSSAHRPLKNHPPARCGQLPRAPILWP